MMYQCQYCMMNSSISECDHKCGTRNAEPEIGTETSSRIWQNPQLDGCGSRFGPPTVSRSGVWMGLEPNWPIYAVQTPTAGRLPGPVANTTCGYTICVSIALQSISQNRSSNMRSCNSWILFYPPLWDLRYWLCPKIYIVHPEDNYHLRMVGIWGTSHCRS